VAGVVVLGGIGVVVAGVAVIVAMVVVLGHASPHRPRIRSTPALTSRSIHSVTSASGTGV
jgi:hypothetical protein